MDLHHNLFYGYRGAITDEGNRERQLENNVTKALVNTLQLGGESVWRPFLTEFGVPEANQAEFLLQKAELPAGSAALKKQRILLGISTTSSNYDQNSNSVQTNSSIPDAWIYGDGFVVLVESKVAGDFTASQMQSHHGKLQLSSNNPPIVKLTTWRDIHRFFARLRPQLTSTPAFLVQQFAEYLEYSKLSGFTQFRREHFDYFLTHDDNEARLWVRSQMEDLAHRLHIKLFKIDPFYESYEVGTLYQTAEYCWAAFGLANKNYRDFTHQSMHIAADGVCVFVNAELKSATDRIKKLLNEQPESLQAALRELHAIEPFDLVLQERIQKQAMIYDCIPKMRLHSSLINDASVGGPAWTAFIYTVRKLPLPYLRIERLINRATLLGVSSDDEDASIDMIANVMHQNHRIVRILNGV